MYDVILFTDINLDIGFAKYAGTYRIASELRNLGASVKVIDCFTKFSEEEIYIILSKYIDESTLFVGISSTLLHKGDNLHGFNNQFFEKLKNHILSINSNTLLILGGSRVNKFTNIKGIDYYFVGKADVSIKEFYLYLKNKTNINISHIENRKFLLTENFNVTTEYFSNTKINYVFDDIIEHHESLPLELSRGCIFKCSFCQYDLIGKKKNEYQKNKNILKEELIRNYELFGTTNYLFTDELINESLEKVKYLHEVFTTLPFNITWSSYARLDLIYAYPEMRELLLEAGAIGLVFGIETLDEKAGKAIKKGLGKNKIFKTLDFLKEKYENKVVISSNFIIGLPYETRESIINTINWLKSKDCSLDSYSLIPLNLRSKDDGRQMSEISLSPEKFGYNKKGLKNNLIEWENENLSFSEAIDIVNDSYNDKEFLKKSILGSGNMIGRVLNLGYSEEQLKNIIFTEKTIEESMNISNTWKTLTQKRNEKYKTKILKG